MARDARMTNSARAPSNVPRERKQTAAVPIRPARTGTAARVALRHPRERTGAGQPKRIAEDRDLSRSEAASASGMSAFVGEALTTVAQCPRRDMARARPELGATVPQPTRMTCMGSCWRSPSPAQPAASPRRPRSCPAVFCLRWRVLLPEEAFDDDLWFCGAVDEGVPQPSVAVVEVQDVGAARCGGAATLKRLSHKMRASSPRPAGSPPRSSPDCAPRSPATVPSSTMCCRRWDIRSPRSLCRTDSPPRRPLRSGYFAAQCSCVT